MTTSTTTKDFFTRYPARACRKGEVLVQAGEYPPVYYIASGSLIQYDISDSGNKLTLNTYKAGAFVSLACLMNDIPSAFFFEAAEQTVVHEAPKVDVVEWLQQTPAVVHNALARISRGGDGMMLRLARAMEGNAESRIISELRIMAARFPSADGSIAVSDTELASQTGLARETVSRALGRLRQRGQVATRRGYITLLDDR